VRAFLTEHQIDNNTPLLSPLALLLLITLPSGETPVPDSNIHLSLNTPLIPTDTMVKNTVVMYRWFIQTETSEIRAPVLAVAVRIECLGMIKVQCTHTADEINHEDPDILKLIK